MVFKSINPYTGKEVSAYKEFTEVQIEGALRRARSASSTWRSTPLEQRTTLVRKAADVLEKNIEKYARTITVEMGKPIAEARAEISKCAWVCRYYADHTEGFLEEEVIETDASRSFVRHDPIGTVLAVMPWNFPFWQVFRFAAPALCAGNTGILKHASNVLGSAEHIEDVFTEAGVPEGVFQNIIVHHDKINGIIASDTIKAVTLTGSEKAGSAVAASAGQHLKKTVLELGGSNAFVVLKDADMEKTVKTAVQARMLNSGQSCIAAKRFIIEDSVYREFVESFTEATKQLKSGDPLHEDTDIGPLARRDLAENLQDQMQNSISKGAKLIHGGQLDGAYHAPTILGDVMPGMPAFDEETFGPLAAMVKARDMEHALELSEMSSFGLGVTICTNDNDKANAFARSVSDGACFVNELVKSDPRLPFGGTKTSGYGRELSKDGMLEFMNRKTVYFK